MKNEERIEKLFEELVPEIGKCDSVAGEMVRAVSRIGYRYYNDGDKIGLGYGNETCNAPARYLQKHGNKKIKILIDDIWGGLSDNIYEICLDRLFGLVADQIEANSSLREKETDDMFDYDDPSDYDYDDYDDYDDDEDDYDE